MNPANALSGHLSNRAVDTRNGRAMTCLPMSARWSTAAYARPTSPRTSSHVDRDIARYAVGCAEIRRAHVMTPSRAVVAVPPHMLLLGDACRPRANAGGLSDRLSSPT